MSWISWLKNLWQPQGPPRGQPTDPESTQDYPGPPKLSVATGMLQLRYGVVSEVGNVREHNEDNFYVPGLPSLSNPDTGQNGSPEPTATWPPPPVIGGLFMVADGMGGQLAGEKASAMAVADIPRELSKRLAPELDEKAVQRAIRDAVARANEEILARSNLESGLSNMGTTIVLALFQDDRVYVAGIGDSRAYRLRGGKLEQLTRDHSLANALGEAGTIRPDEVENHKFKHVLYLYLGSKDARDGPEDVRVLDCRPGDQYLLASDGLTGVVRDEGIVEILQSSDDPQKSAQTLVHRALENRSKDNITCVVIHVY